MAIILDWIAQLVKLLFRYTPKRMFYRKIVLVHHYVTNKCLLWCPNKTHSCDTLFQNALLRHFENIRNDILILYDFPPTFPLQFKMKIAKIDWKINKTNNLYDYTAVSVTLLTHPLVILVIMSFDKMCHIFLVELKISFKKSHHTWKSDQTCRRSKKF